jgi:hypothetical protein
VISRSDADEGRTLAVSEPILVVAVVAASVVAGLSTLFGP